MLSELVHFKILKDFMTTLEANDLSLVSKEANLNVGNAPWNDTKTVVEGSIRAWRQKFPFATAINLQKRWIPEWEFGELQGLTYIDLSNTNVADRHFHNFQGVKVLKLNNCRDVTGAGFEYLKGIRELHIENNDINGDTFQWLKGIQILNIKGNNLITDEAFRKLNDSSIHTLDISRTNLNGSCFQWLQGIHTLDMMDCDQIQNDSLRWLKGIKVLNMSLCYQITNLQWLKGIHTLYMRGCSGVTVESFRSLKGIHFLDMSRCDISGECLKYLTGIHSLIIDDCHYISGLDIIPLGSIDFISVVRTSNNVKRAAKKVGRIVNIYGSWRSVYYRKYNINKFLDLINEKFE